MSDIKKDSRTTSETQSSGDIDLFKKDSIEYFVLKKTERISAALLLVSDCIKEHEPLKDELSVCAIEMVKRAVYWRSSQLTTQEDESLHFIFTEALSLLTIGAVKGDITAMNRKLVDQEIRFLLKVLKDSENTGGSKYEHVFLPDFFEVLGGKQYLSQQHRGNQHWGAETWRNLEGGAGKGRENGYAHRRENKKNLARDNSRNVQGKKSDRRGAIIDLIRGKGSVSIKDITAIITDCSEKTLQRELLALVTEGVLRKEGERRWSTYHLAA